MRRLPASCSVVAVFRRADASEHANGRRASHAPITKRAPARKKREDMKDKRFAKVLSIAAAVTALVGCFGTIHGGGIVEFFAVETGNGPGQPTAASVAVAVTCNDARDQLRATFHLTDNTNGVNFTAQLPWTPVEDFDASVTTCAEAAAFVDAEGFSVVPAIVNAQGQASGQMVAVVTEKGEFPECEGEAQIVALEAIGDPAVLPGGLYAAAGCLVNGNIVFQ